MVTDRKKGLMITYLLTDYHTPNLEMLSHLIIYNLQSSFINIYFWWIILKCSWCLIQVFHPSVVDKTDAFLCTIKYNNTTTIPLSLIHVDVDDFLILILMKVFEYWEAISWGLYIWTIGHPWVSQNKMSHWILMSFENWGGLGKWRGEEFSRK